MSSKGVPGTAAGDVVAGDASLRTGRAAGQTGQAADKARKIPLYWLQLAGLAVMILGFGGRFLFPGIEIFPLVGIAGWAFFGGATATSNLLLQVVSTVLVLAIAGVLYVLLPEAPGVSIALAVGYIGGLVGGWTVRRSRVA